MSNDLAKDMSIKVWLDREIKLIEPMSAPSATDYGDGAISAPQMWDIRYNGTGIKIAILDTGIDGMHLDLDGGRLLLQIPLLSELLKTQEKPVLIASGEVSW